MKRNASVLALLLFVAAPLASQSDKTDDFLKAEMQRQRIPGLSVAVVKEGRIVKAAGYGVTEIKGKTPATPETVYKIASVSKQFIASGIMLLVQEGRLGIDDPMSRHLDDVPAAWNPITVRHLLTHTSGLVREAPGFKGTKVQSDADVIKSAYTVPLRFAPGEKWEYSNLGYFALAEIIRRVSGRSWPDYLTEKVFKPAGMNTTFTTDTKANVPNRAVGYTDNDNWREAGDWPALRPSGAFLSTVLDLAKWDAALYTDKILTEASRREMWTPVTLTSGTTHSYGFGWQLDQGKRERVYHTGGMIGFRSGFVRFPDDRLTIIVLMNLDDVDIDAIVQGLAAISLPAR